MSAVLQMDSFQNICDSILPGPYIDNIFQHSLIMKIFMSCHVLIASEFLRQITDKSLKLFPHFLGVEPIDPDLAITLFKDTTNYSHKRRFACTIRPQKTKHTVPYI